MDDDLAQEIIDLHRAARAANRMRAGACGILFGLMLGTIFGFRSWALLLSAAIPGIVGAVTVDHVV